VAVARPWLGVAAALAPSGGRDGTAQPGPLHFGDGGIGAELEQDGPARVALPGAVGPAGGSERGEDQLLAYPVRVGGVGGK
jgi:hypothetical protein